jgi:hypothetical protein
VRSRDTSPEAHEIQMQIYRSMTPGRRIELGFEMSEEAFEVMAAGIRMRHPNYTEDQVRWALIRLRTEDDDLFRRAWPDAPLLAP